MKIYALLPLLPYGIVLSISVTILQMNTSYLKAFRNKYDTVAIEQNKCVDNTKGACFWRSNLFTVCGLSAEVI